MAQILFENGNLFDGVSPDIRDGMSVLVEGNEIKEVCDRPIRVDEADRIDCRGKTVMPGLIDNHVHIYIDQPLRPADYLSRATCPQIPAPHPVLRFHFGSGCGRRRPRHGDGAA